MKNIYPLCVAVGLILEFIGAFVLAAEAIGLRRLEGWHARLLKSRTPSLRGNLVLGAVSIGASVMISRPAIRVLQRLWTQERTFPAMVAFEVIRLSTALLASIVQAAVIVSVAFMLLRVKSWSENRTAGIIGFGFLAAAFVLQLVGVVGEWLRPFE